MRARFTELNLVIESLFPRKGFLQAANQEEQNLDLLLKANG